MTPTERLARDLHAAVRKYWLEVEGIEMLSPWSRYLSKAKTRFVAAELLKTYQRKPQDRESVIEAIEQCDPLLAICDWECGDDIAHAVKSYILEIVSKPPTRAAKRTKGSV